MEGSKPVNNTKIQFYPKKEHHVRKRRSQKPETSECCVFVNTKTPIKGSLAKCEKLIEKGESEIIIYCLGAAIQRGILLALQVCEKHVGFRIHTNTLTTELIGKYDLEPAVDDADYTIQRRNNSALRIRLFKPDLLKPECSLQSTS